MHRRMAKEFARIEEHYNDISMSLSASSGTNILEGDTSAVVQDRTNIFEKKNLKVYL